jgi:hypothetical protein
MLEASDVFAAIMKKQVSLSMLVKVAVNRTVINVLIGVGYGYISYNLLILPLTFDCSPTFITKLTRSREFIAEKRPFINAIRKLIVHFSVNF